MIKLGLRLDWLGTPALSWRDLKVIVKHSPRDSALVQAIDPRAAHTNELELLRGLVYNTSLLVWLQTEDAQKRRNQPKPLRFPWEPATGLVDADVMTKEEMARRLGWAA